MKWVFVDEDGKAWVVEADDKHRAIAKAVEEGYSDDMTDFYYGYEDGQIQVLRLAKEV